MSVHGEKLTLATAAWLEVSAKAKEHEAAILRNDDEAAKKARQEAHDMLDTALDLYAEATVAVKKLINP